jgi:hypothetical protein
MAKRKSTTTREHGQAHAIALLREYRDRSDGRAAPTKRGNAFDAAIREALTWPAEARRGFSYVVGDWLATEAGGFGYTIDGYEAARKRGLRGTDNPEVRHG